MPQMTTALYALLLGMLSGLFLTLMDRIDEHNAVRRFKTPLAWLCGVLAAAFMVLSMQRFTFIYPFLFDQCLEWIMKGKIDYPSHVFCLFLLALWFGQRLDLLDHFAPVIGLFIGVRWFSGSWLKGRIQPRGRVYRVLYASYLEKILSNILLAAFVSEWLLLVYSVGYTCSCRITKNVFPEQQPALVRHA